MHAHRTPGPSRSLLLLLLHLLLLAPFAQAPARAQAPVTPAAPERPLSSPVAQAERLREARRALADGQDDAAAAAFARLLAEPSWTAEPLWLAEALGFFARAGRVAEAWVALRQGAAGASLFSATLPADAARRSALAEAWAALASDPAAGADAERLWRRLYSELPETPAARARQAAARAALGAALPALALPRARTLSARHDNATVLEELSPLRAEGDTDERACEIRYLLGKAARKERKYGRARRELDFVGSRCGEPWRKKARFLAAQVASFGKGTSGLAKLEAFLDAYPKDGLSDDVWLWKAEMLERAGRAGEAASAYEQLIADHPEGDMYDTARLGLAFLRARGGDAEGARAALADVAEAPRARSPLVADQARYWRARLRAFPHFDDWRPHEDAAAHAEGLEALRALARARPAGFYGHLAARLVGEPLATAADAAAGRGLPDASAGLRAAPPFAAATALADAGFPAEAALWLDRVPQATLSEDDALAVTALYARVGAHGRSHQVLRARGDALPPGAPDAAAAPLWRLSFPRAHAEAIEAGAAAAGLPPALLFGLAREESAFEAEVVSWAGAIGLCQLMPFTAREEAARLKLPLASLEALREPALNARLGAAHLARRLSLGHPLLAIAAYNAGPGNVAKWRKALTTRALDAFVEQIPVEQTRGYVKKVTGSWVVYRALYGGDDSRLAFSMTLPAR